METNKIYNEDCFATMQMMVSDNQKIDIVLTSPPYNTSRVGNENSFKGYTSRYDIFLDNKTDEEYIDWTLNLFELYDKVLSENGVILYNISYGGERVDLLWLTIAELIKHSNFTCADCIVWKKNSALPNNTTPNKMTRITEFVFVFSRKSEFDTFKTAKPITGTSKTGQAYYGSFFNFIEAPNNDGKNPYNNATFSTGLVKRLLKMYANPNSVVYDSFMGTGTTAVACKEFGCGYIGSELSENQCKYAYDRLGAVIKDKKASALF